MITLSEFLNTIPFPESASKSVQVAIREAKRLEALDVPRVEAERKPLIDDEGDELYVIWSNGKCIDWGFCRDYAKESADKHSQETGQPHTVCQVMAPVDGECTTIPVATFTPERPHEWTICSTACVYRGRWYATHRRGDGYWAYDLPSEGIQRFPTATEAQDYIDTHQIADAYPWPVPKLS